MLLQEKKIVRVVPKALRTLVECKSDSDDNTKMKHKASDGSIFSSEMITSCG